MIDSIKRDEDFLNGRLGGIKQPTLIVWGKQDGLLPLADGEKFDKEIPNSELKVFDQCGHAPQIEKAEFNTLFEILGGNAFVLVLVLRR